MLSHYPQITTSRSLCQPHTHITWLHRASSRAREVGFVMTLQTCENPQEPLLRVSSEGVKKLWVVSFLFFLQLLIFLPEPSNAFFFFFSFYFSPVGKLFHLLLLSTLFFPFCCIPWSVYFFHSHSVSVFFCAIVLNYLIVVLFLFSCSLLPLSFLVCLGSLLLWCTTHPAYSSEP